MVDSDEIIEGFDTGAYSPHVPNTSPTPAKCKCNANEMPRFHRYKMTDLLALPIPKWLIRDMIYEKQVAVFCASSGSFKSFIALALCSMLAHEMPWMGRKLKKRRCIYLAGEGFPLFGQRRMAWFNYHGIDYADDGVEVIDGTVNLLDDADVDAFIESTKDCTDIDLLAIDTLSTSVAGEDENTSPVMSKAVENAKRIGRALGCAVLIIHHPGKDVERGLRGHSSLGANIDSVWMGKKKNLTVSIETMKQRDGEDHKIFHFEAHVAPLGIYDDEGVEVCSLALTVCDEPEDFVAGEESEELKRERDLQVIVSILKIDATMSQTALAKECTVRFDCKERQAIRRIGAAIPADVWTETKRLDKDVKVTRLLPEKVGQAHKIRMEMAYSVR
jgi:AAA domain